MYQRNFASINRYLLTLIALAIGLTSVHGGYGLVAQNGLNLPIDWLEGSPFHSYLIPGLILIIVVGGTHILAAVCVWKKTKYSLELSAIAAFGLLIWLFTEMYIIPHKSWLQILYFSAAIVMLILAIILSRIGKY